MPHVQSMYISEPLIEALILEVFYCNQIVAEALSKIFYTPTHSASWIKLTKLKKSHVTLGDKSHLHFGFSIVQNHKLQSGIFDSIHISCVCQQWVSMDVQNDILELNAKNSL